MANNRDLQNVNVVDEQENVLVSGVDAFIVDAQYLVFATKEEYKPAISLGDSRVFHIEEDGMEVKYYGEWKLKSITGYQSTNRTMYVFEKELSV